MTEQSTDCPICLNILDKEDQVSCLHCDVAVCTECFVNYLLSREHDVSCHSCNKPWSEDFVDEHADDAFRNGALRQHRTKFLIDQEEARLPDLQDRARRFKTASSTSSKTRYVRHMIESYGAPIHHWFNETDCAAAEALYGPGWARGGSAAPVPKKVVLRACPLECRGFLDQEGKCGMCAKQVCLKCHESLDSKTPQDDHKCDPAAVATVRLLAKETKPCPTCHAPIFKIDGCDQMWCTLCQTPFSWITGQKETGRVHNPHYYEWMRRTQGSVPREPECRDGQLRDWRRTNTTLTLRLLQDFHRTIAEEAQYNRPPAANDEAINVLGVRYLAGDLPKQEWARRVYIEKRHMKRFQAVYEIRRAFAAAGTDIMNAFLDKPEDPGTESARALADLMVYMQESIYRVYDRYFYKGKGISILPGWWRIASGFNYSRLSEVCGIEISSKNTHTNAEPEPFMKFVNWILGA
jgi:hypothetical protein